MKTEATAAIVVMVAILTWMIQSYSSSNSKSLAAHEKAEVVSKK